MQDDNNRLTKNLAANLGRIIKNAPKGTQAEIARRSGIHPVYLSQLIGGSRPNPTLATVNLLAAAVGVPPWDLIRPNPPDQVLRIRRRSGRHFRLVGR